MRFTPFVAITEIGVDTNVFNQALEPQRDTTATFGPGAEYWVRAGRARISAKSDVQYNWFRDFSNQRSLSTNNDLKIEFPMTRLTPFVDGIFDHGRVRPGYEIDTRAFRTDSGVGGGVMLASRPRPASVWKLIVDVSNIGRTSSTSGTACRKP